MHTLLAYIPKAKQHSSKILALFKQLIPCSGLFKLYSSKSRALQGTWLSYQDEWVSLGAK